MKYCKCGNPRPGNSPYCHSCFNAYMREWRKTHKVSEEQRKKEVCRAYAREYLKRGFLVREPCEICESYRTVMHHDDYDKPLFVRWMCPSCHNIYHQMIKNYKLTKGKNEQI